MFTHRLQDLLFRRLVLSLRNPKFQSLALDSESSIEPLQSLLQLTIQFFLRAIHFVMLDCQHIRYVTPILQQEESQCRVLRLMFELANQFVDPEHYRFVLHQSYFPYFMLGLIPLPIGRAKLRQTRIQLFFHQNLSNFHLIFRF